jgi:hypothetical protein
MFMVVVSQLLPTNVLYNVRVETDEDVDVVRPVLHLIPKKQAIASGGEDAPCRVAGEAS